MNILYFYLIKVKIQGFWGGLVLVGKKRWRVKIKGLFYERRYFKF